jgi:hypothetical protein
VQNYSKSRAEVKGKDLPVGQPKKSLLTRILSLLEAGETIVVQQSGGASAPDKRTIAPSSIMIVVAGIMRLFVASKKTNLSHWKTHTSTKVHVLLCMFRLSKFSRKCARLKIQNAVSFRTAPVSPVHYYLFAANNTSSCGSPNYDELVVSSTQN